MPLYSQFDRDSLWNVWNDELAADTTRLIALIEIANKGYLFSQPDSAYILAQKAYDFASAMDLKREMTNALSTQATSFYVKGDFNGALEHYQKCLSIYEEIEDQNGIAKILNNIGVMHSSLGNFVEAMDYHQRSLAIKEQINDKKGMAS
jgi:tetratricopeptide (TPR) repeat protein